VTKHLADYVNLAIAIHGVAVVVVNITPTPKDNEALGTYRRLAVKLYRAIELMAGIFNSPNVKR
jgi:hypothetical protein